MKLALIVNPTCDRGRGRTHARRAAQGLSDRGVDFAITETSSFEQGVEATASLTKRDCDAVVAVGGDGTVNAVANGLLRIDKAHRPALGLVPCGRGNDFAAMMGLVDREAALDALVAGTRRWVDVGKTRAGAFLGVAGAGFDSKVARRAQRQIPLLGGTAVYVYALLRTLTELRAIPARIAYEGGTYDGLITFAVAGNTDRYGGGMRITPKASVEDGLLDLCVVGRVSRLTLLKVFPRVFSGRHLQHPAVFYTKSPWITIDSPEPTELFADGEFLQPLPVRIDVVPSALAVLTPWDGRPCGSS